MRSGSLFRVPRGRLMGFGCIVVLLLLGLLSAVNSASLLASTTPQIAGGWKHTIDPKSDGTVWAWGNNGGGQLGDVTEEDSSTPVQVSGINLYVTTTPTTVATPSLTPTPKERRRL